MPARPRAASPRRQTRARQETVAPPLEAALAVLLELMADAASSGHVRVMAAKAVLSQAIQPREPDKMSNQTTDDSRARVAAIGAITQLLEELAAAKSVAGASSNPSPKTSPSDDHGHSASPP